MRGSKGGFGSNLTKVDATTDEDISRQIAEDPDTAPELTNENVDGAEIWEGDRFVRAVGRPKGSGKKELVTLRIDRDLIAHFRATGPGWQTRLNDALRAAVIAEPDTRGNEIVPGVARSPGGGARSLRGRARSHR